MNRMNRFALKLYFIVSEHSTLCILKHSLLTILFQFGKTDFQSVWTTYRAQMQVSPIHVCENYFTVRRYAVTQCSNILRAQSEVSDLR